MAGFDDLPLVPRDGVQEVGRAEWRGLNAGIYARIAQLPADATGKAGEVVAINDDETGAAVASEGGVAAMTFGRRPVSGFRFDPVSVTASRDITDQLCGKQIQCSNSSPIQLNILLDADPALGVSDGFTCEVWVFHDAADVQLTFSGVVNREPSGNTRIPPGCKAAIQIAYRADLDEYSCGIFGATEP